MIEFQFEEPVPAPHTCQAKWRALIGERESLALRCQSPPAHGGQHYHRGQARDGRWFILWWDCRPAQEA